ncbi:MAG: DotU family type IV/VI secretion system protein [Planctomycetes bacterium]|nr:DotU family type IV/VI secretion system protein [Planctomycetota bacterium]
MAESSEPRPKLSDLAADIFALAFQLRATKDPGAFAHVRAQVTSLFSEFETAGRSHGFKAEGVANAKYALAAFVDELVLSTNWQLKDEWAGNPLQLEFFNDFAAGEEFYKKLKAVRDSQDSERLEAAEVFLLCLIHGFKGMYMDLRGMEERKALVEALAGELRAARGSAPAELSPAWQPPDVMPKLVRSSPVWLAPAICLAALILLALGLAFAADFLGSSAAEAMAPKQ